MIINDLTIWFDQTFSSVSNCKGKEKAKISFGVLKSGGVSHNKVELHTSVMYA